MALQVETGTGAPAARHVRLWPVAWTLPISAEQAARSMRLLVQTASSSGFVSSLSLVLRGGGGVPIQAWIGASTLDHTGRESELLRRLAAATAPWIGLGEPRNRLGPPAGSSVVRMRFRAVDPRDRVTARWSSLWRLIADGEHPWQLTVGLGFVGSNEDVVDVGVSMVGEGDEGGLVGALLDSDIRSAEDRLGIEAEYLSAADADCVSTQAAHGYAPAGTLVPIDIAARLMGLLARVESGWPVVPSSPSATTDLVAALDRVRPPHLLVQGASGQGKTTLLEHLVSTDVDAGRPVVVICPHGDLAARAATRLGGRGAPVQIVDLGAPEPVTWNLTEPDPGIDPEAHASLLVAVLRDLWPDTPESYFGPVWVRQVRAAMAVLVRDPAGPWPLTRILEVFDSESSFRAAALERIGDPALTAVLVSELDPMVNQRDPGNTLAWLVGKLDPLIADPTLRRVTAHRVSTLSVARILQGESLIVALPERQLTKAASRLLGGMLVGRVWNLVKRHGLATPVTIYLDEWQRLPVPAIAELLAEGRKYGVRLRLANQNSAQIPATLWETAIGNVGGVVTFRTGPADAARLEPLFVHSGAESLTTLPDHWLASAVGGRELVAEAPPPLAGDGGAALQAGHGASVSAARRAFHRVVAERTRRVVEQNAGKPGSLGRIHRVPEPPLSLPWSP